MPAWMIADVEIRDRERYVEYVQAAMPTLVPFGARPIVRGAAGDVLEGDWQPRHLTILEFPDAASASAWHAGESYQTVADVRREAATMHMLVVEGVPNAESGGAGAGYVIVDVTVTDPEKYGGYVRLAGPTIAAHGGRMIGRGAPPVVLEGDWHPAQLGLLAFPSVDAARRWYDSPGYAEAKAARASAADVRLVVAQGI